MIKEDRVKNEYVLNKCELNTNMSDSVWKQEMHWDILLIYRQRDQSAEQIYEEIVKESQGRKLKK